MISGNTKEAHIARQFAAYESKITKLEAHIEILRECSEHFANFACSEADVCNCHNCTLRDVLVKTTKQSLAKHDAEVIQKMCITLKENLRINKDVHSYCNFPNELILEYANNLESK